MHLFSDLEDIVKEKHPLTKHTWFGLGGAADYFIQPTTVEQLSEVARRCYSEKLTIRVLGYGSNLLVSDKGVRGAVLKLDQGVFTETTIDDQMVTAWAGVELSALILDCVKKGLSGLESLTGIPGTIGGAVRMNAGGRFGEIGMVVEAAGLMDREGQTFEKAKPELAFDYRSSNITAPLILSAHMRLNTGDPEQIMRTVQEAWIHRKNTQPLNARHSSRTHRGPRRER